MAQLDLYLPCDLSNLPLIAIWLFGILYCLLLIFSLFCTRTRFLDVVYFSMKLRFFFFFFSPLNIFFLLRRIKCDLSCLLLLLLWLLLLLLNDPRHLHTHTHTQMKNFLYKNSSSHLEWSHLFFKETRNKHESSVKSLLLYVHANFIIIIISFYYNTNLCKRKRTRKKTQLCKSLFLIFWISKCNLTLQS